MGRIAAGSRRQDARAVAVYDPPMGWMTRRSSSEPISCSCCVPTPYGPDGYDCSAVENVVGLVQKRDALIVIRSTVLPGTTARLQGEKPAQALVFMPEFLNAATAQQDFANPAITIVGVTPRSANRARFLFEFMPSSGRNVVMPPRLPS